MTEPTAPDSPTFVKIIHPETGGIAEVPESSLATWWRSGWRPLAEEDVPPAVEDAAPEAVSAEEVAAAQAGPEDKSSRRSGKTTKE